MNCIFISTNILLTYILLLTYSQIIKIYVLSSYLQYLVPTISSNIKCNFYYLGILAYLFVKREICM